MLMTMVATIGARRGDNGAPMKIGDNSGIKSVGSNNDIRNLMNVMAQAYQP